MSSLASTFRRVTTPTASCRGIRWAITSTPSTRKRTSSAVLLGLEVDVAGAVLGGLEDDRVHEPDDRPFGDAVVGGEVVGVILDRLVGVVVEDGGEGDVRPASAA